MFFQASEFGSYGLIEGFMWGLASSLESLQARVAGLPSIIICFPAKLSIHHFRVPSCCCLEFASVISFPRV